jgi:hypothetical protein
MDVFARLLLTFKEYKNASCGFVDILIDSLLKILYEEPLSLLSRNWINGMEIAEC